MASMAYRGLQIRPRNQAALWIGFLFLGVVGVGSEARASHHRGVDDWASIDVNGGVTVTARTRWRKGAFGDPNFFGQVGISPLRFGANVFACGYDHSQVVTVPLATGMQIVCASGGGCGGNPLGTIMYAWPADCDFQTQIGTTDYECYGFTQDLTTVSTDTTQPSYEERVQVLPIPLGSQAMPGQIVTPRNLPQGDYDIQWVDSSRVPGIQNINPNETCPANIMDSSYGSSARAR
jgi:hypothetical protein